MRNVATTGKRVGYGWLYNWYAVDNASGLAPDGWRVPSDAEWTELTDYLESFAHIDDTNVGGVLKSTRNEWDSPNTDATNEFGFEALPGGARRSYASFEYIGIYHFCWSSTETDFQPQEAWIRRPRYDSGVLGRGYSHKTMGMNLRCIQNKKRGESDGDTGTLEDIDGNVYKWVVIGDYRWMAENLRTTKYRDGTNIPNVIDDTEWENLTTGARCAYNNDHYFVYPPKK